MESIISTVSAVVTAAAGWVGTFVDTVTAEPLLLMFAVIPVVGLGVGLLRRLLSVN